MSIKWPVGRRFFCTWPITLHWLTAVGEQPGRVRNIDINLHPSFSTIGFKALDFPDIIDNKSDKWCRLLWHFFDSSNGGNSINIIIIIFSLPGFCFSKPLKANFSALKAHAFFSVQIKKGRGKLESSLEVKLKESCIFLTQWPRKIWESVIEEPYSLAMNGSVIDKRITRLRMPLRHQKPYVE